MASVDVTALNILVEEGYLTCRSHPTADLLIWNYTAKTQYEPYWTPETEMCRGLITTSEGEIVSRCLKKFMNVEEWEDLIGELPREPFKVTEKWDGSLAISYLVDGVPYLATRGSFTSEQALHATKILHEKYAEFLPAFQQWHYYTFLFEYIAPRNRIVVDYGEMEDLVLLTVIHTETGKEYDPHDPAWVEVWPFPVVRQYDGIKDVAELRAMEEANKEGFVLRFESGMRLKCKFSDYVRLHKIITQTTARTVWEYLKESRSLAELYDRVPEEFSQWLKATTRDLSGKYDAIYHRTREIYKEITQNASIPLMLSLGASLSVRDVEVISRAMKKHIQQEFTRYPDIEAFLLMLYSGGSDKKERVREAIWDTLRPEATRPFRNEQNDEGEEVA